MSFGLEMGMTYRKNGRYYVAVGPNMMVTWRGGDFVEQEAGRDEEAVRGMSCRALCDAWSCSPSTLDALSDRYIKPLAPEQREPSERTVRRRRAMALPAVRMVHRAG